MQTSRIRLALSVVQLFVTRCLMNLEPEVSPGSIRKDRWEWMRRYRVWEANRKIFLYPENWLEPELRDGKSPFFRELASRPAQVRHHDRARRGRLSRLPEEARRRRPPRDRGRATSSRGSRARPRTTSCTCSAAPTARPASTGTGAGSTATGRPGRRLASTSRATSSSPPSGAASSTCSGSRRSRSPGAATRTPPGPGSPSRRGSPGAASTSSSPSTGASSTGASGRRRSPRTWASPW